MRWCVVFVIWNFYLQTDWTEQLPIYFKLKQITVVLTFLFLFNSTNRFVLSLLSQKHIFGIVHLKWKSFHYLITLMLFQTCMTNFPLLNKEISTVFVHNNQLCVLTFIVIKIFSILQKKVIQVWNVLMGMGDDLNFCVNYPYKSISFSGSRYLWLLCPQVLFL